MRELLSAGLGKVLTPEMAADIEMAARRHLAYVEKVGRLADEIVRHPQDDLPVLHHFADGIYGRQIDMPAGTLLIGAPHRLESIVVVSKGKIMIATQDGPVTVSAGETLVCRAGTQNVGFAVEDVRWTNFFPNPGNICEPESLVEMVSFMKADEILGGRNNVQLLMSGKTSAGALK